MSFDYPAYFREAAEHYINASHRDDLKLAATIIERQKKAIERALAEGGECGTPTPKGYRSTCSKHAPMINIKQRQSLSSECYYE